MRIAYLDEAGLSTKAHEPHVVVAGVITNPDTHYQVIEAHIRALAADVLGDKAKSFYGKPYVFHAQDVWHGSGDFKREEWPLPTRMALLKALCQIPKDFDLPVIFGVVAKKDRNAKLSFLHNEAYLLTAKRLEGWMDENTRNEVVAIISERCDKEHMARITAFHQLIVDKSMSDRPALPHQFVSKHIIEAPIFLDKYSSPLLQLADVCAFVLKRKMQKCPHVEPLFDLLKGAMWHKPKPGNSVMIRAKVEDLVWADSGEPYTTGNRGEPS